MRCALKFFGTLADDFYKKLNSRSDLALILGVLKRYRSAEESDDPYTMHLWSQIDPIVVESVVAECPHDDLLAEAEEEGFSNYRVLLRLLQILHKQPRTRAETPGENSCLTSLPVITVVTWTTRIVQSPSKRRGLVHKLSKLPIFVNPLPYYQ
ncbi:hypothetical protein PROFUN_15827, partial [Planoprotostelium fungivorum]